MNVGSFNSKNKFNHEGETKSEYNAPLLMPRK